MYCSGNKKIDDFIQEMQLKRNSHNDIMFEWIPYNQFNNIRKIDKDDFSTIYLATWKNGPLYWSRNNEKYKRKSDKQVALKRLYDSHNAINEFLNEV